MVVGDIMLGRRVADTPAARRDPSAPLRPLQDYLSGADITVGNFESTLSRDGPPQQGGDSFAARPAVLKGLHDAGFDVLSLANNHVGDFGDRALRQTLARIRNSPIDAVGAGLTLEQAWSPAVVRRHGITLGFVAFNAIGESPRATPDRAGVAEVRMPPRTGPLSRADLRRATREVRRLSKRVDLVIALPHWGDQYTHRPVPSQRTVGRALLDAGADLVVGGHPHWVQSVERYRGKLLVHSLGNFVFDMDFMRQTMQGVMLEATIVGTEIRRVRFVPYAMGPDFVPRRVRGERAAEIVQPLGVPRDLRLAS